MTRRRFALLPGLLALAFTACDGKKTAVVSGTVTLDGQAITFGTVAFVGTDGRVDQAMITPDGRYSIPKAPVGDVVITVVTYPLPPQVQPPDQPASKASTDRGGAKYTPIPPAYGDAKLSPLKYSVQAGDQQYDIKLTNKK
jgi:hypothetical protein